MKRIERPDRRAALLAGWLRRTRASGHAETWVLRGSLVTAALCPSARPPADVDYVLAATAADFDPDAITAAVHAIAALPDPSTTLTVTSTEPIFAETSSPGVRAHLIGTMFGDARRSSPHHELPAQDEPAGDDAFQIDLAVGDPMAVPPRMLAIADVGPVLACAGETMVGWKAHGLCEYGRGRWRAKDLFDLDILWREAALDLHATRAALALAFSSRGHDLSALDDLRTRADWGASRGGVRKWRALARSHPLASDFAATLTRVRAALAVLLGPPPPT